MCYGCWEKDGKPSIVNEKTIAASKLIEEVYKHSRSGGNLHVIIDDWNYQPEHLVNCLADIKRNDYGWSYPAALEAERACAEALLALTVEERGSALAIQEEIIKV